MLHQENFTCSYENKTIAGSLTIPSGMTPFPLLIYSHGFGYAYEEISLSKLAKHGIATCRFDFCGGSINAKSSGSSLDMSVLTEAQDLEAVLDYVLQDSRFDTNQIYLAGNSQGAYVSTIVGIKHQKNIQGLFLLCPAFIISDFKKIFTQGKIPSHPFQLDNLVLSPKYVEDIEKYPIYEHMKEFTKPVYIYHGTADNLAPIHYSRIATEQFSNSKLFKIPGAGHMLSSHAKLIEEDIIHKILLK